MTEEISKQLEERAKECGWTEELQRKFEQNKSYDVLFRTYRQIQVWEAKFEALLTQERYQNR